MCPFDISYTQSSAVCIFTFYVVLRCKNKLEKLPKLKSRSGVMKTLKSEQSPGFQARESRQAFT